MSKGALTVSNRLRHREVTDHEEDVRRAVIEKSFQAKKPGSSLGLRLNSLLHAAELVRKGLPFGVIAKFQRISGLTLERIKEVAHLSAGSFSRRMKSGRLSPEESERILRLSRTFECAVSLYDGDVEGAVEWLETPIPSLGNQRPLDLAQTEPGAREVEDLIGRIEHGVVS